jgi:hypothetical protein
MGKVEPAESAGGVIVRLSSAASDAKTAWQTLQEEVGEAEVDPVLLDESGEPHYPTGEVTVRFLKAPTSEFLSSFTRKYDLEVKSQNKYVPEQLAFTPANHKYLPDLVDQLQRAENVANAWANTMSHYRRA